MRTLATTISPQDGVPPNRKGPCPPFFAYHASTFPNPSLNCAHSAMAASPLGTISSIVFPNDFSLVRRKYSWLRGLSLVHVAGRIKFAKPPRLFPKASAKVTCNAIVWCGKTWGVSGYVFSRYSAIRIESEMYTPVAGSWMAGRVYWSLPSAFLDVGKMPSFLQSGSMSGYSTHSVLYGIPLKFRVYLGREVMSE